MKTESLSYARLLELHTELTSDQSERGQLALEAVTAEMHRREITSGKKSLPSTCRRVALTGTAIAEEV